MTFGSPLSARRLTAMLCGLLMLLFAGVQGVNRLDRMQHDLIGTAAHQHGPLSIVEYDAVDADHATGRHRASGAATGMTAQVGPSTDALSPDAPSSHIASSGASTGALATSGDHGPDPVPAPHHHHNADHGSGIPASASADTGAAPPRALRQAIAHIRAIAGAATLALERPPKPLSIAI